jgi:TolA-binding protein
MCGYMKILRFPVFALLLFCLIPFYHLDAQRTDIAESADQDFFRGMELFSKQKYGAAQDRFDRVIDRYDDNYAQLKEEASWYSALCAVELFNRDAEYLLYQFINHYPESQKINQAYYELGMLAYRNNSYYSALRWFDRVDDYLLKDEVRYEFIFKKGYCHFKRKEFDQARTALYKVKDTDSKYASPATYYYAHIAYMQENYETALEGFLKLSDDDLFSPIVPYYISQIYYLQEKWEQVIEYAPPLLESVTEKRYPEMAKIIGEAYFHLEEYKESIVYLEKFNESGHRKTNHDKYQLGFAYYMEQDYEKARDLFKSVSLGQSELTQSALYHLADCYLRLDNKKQARLSFAAASRMDFDPQIKEDALFNYAVVTYEISYTPFNDAVKVFNHFISLYPSSEKTDLAYHYLVLAYMSTKNYSEALESLEKIKRKTPDIERAYQRVAFFRGLELFKNLRFNEALTKFDASLKYGNYDPAIKSLCYYWKGESYYRLADYEQAREFYNNFFLSEGAGSVSIYTLCHYNMAYVFFKEENYGQALSWFRKFENLSSSVPSKVLGDSYNRIGDLYYLDSKYQQAIDYYQKAIDLDMVDVDYALFQKGFCLGLQNKHSEKIAVMSQIISGHEGSSYLADATYEIGRSYFILQQPGSAIPKYKEIVEKFPKSSYVSKALLQLGLIYYNLDQNDESLDYYKRVVTEYPGSPEAESALTGIRNVYVDANRVNDYVAYVNSLGEEVDLTISEQDSLTYIAAENVYMNGDCENAINSFGEYIRDFEEGRFLLQAHFYKTECHLRNNEYEEALASLNYVISQPRSTFTEPALVSASQINYELKNYTATLEHFLMLEEIAEVKSNISLARIGKMRCYYELEDHSFVIEAARSVLMDEKLSEEIEREARFKTAKSYYALDRFALARDEFALVAREVKSLEGAESKYRVAELLFIRKEYEQAADVIFEFIDMNTPHQYWMAKAFIILADIYVLWDDEFQAVQTLQSIIDYYENTTDGIVDLATRKKMEITRKEMEQEQEKGVMEDTLEIEITGGQ